VGRNTNRNRIDMDALSQMVGDYETQLKFVVTDASDLPQIRGPG